MAPVTKSPQQKSTTESVKARPSKSAETGLALQTDQAPGAANLQESRYSPSQVLYLQRTVGNRATAQLLGRSAPAASSGMVIQAKLSVGPANDKYENEADKVAQSVMRSPAPVQRNESEEEESEGVQRTPAISGIQRSPDPIQRNESEEEESEGVQRTPAISHIQRDAQVGLEGGPVNSDMERKINSARSGGSSLSSGMRNKLEPKLNADLSNVKVHTDTKSVQMNRDLGAKAFTHKNHIFYGAGSSPSDTKLTTHEAVHTIQQGAVEQKSVQRHNKGGKNKEEN